MRIAPYQLHNSHEIIPNMKKRIAVLLQGYTSGKSGGDIACIRIMQRLPINSYQLFVFSSSQGIALCKKEKLGAQYITTSDETSIRNIVYTYIERVIVLIRFNHQGYDIIYCSSDSFPDVLSALYLKYRNPNAVWIQKMYHFVSIDRLVSFLIQALMLIIIKQFAKYIIVASKEMRRKLTQKGISSSNIVVNYLGSEEITFVSKRKTEKNSAVFIGRFHQSKGVNDIVPITKHILSMLPDCHITIIGQGTGTEKKRLHGDIRTNHLEKNLTVTGYLSDTKAWQLAKEAGLIILPSYEEGFSLTISTALAYHIGVIAYKLSLYDELFPHAMIQVKKGNHIGFSRAMIKFWQKKGGRSQRYPLHLYSWDKAAITEMQYL